MPGFITHAAGLMLLVTVGGSGGIDGRGGAPPSAPTAAPSRDVRLVPGRTNVLEVHPGPTPLLERNPTFHHSVPSFRRALLLDGDRRWKEAAAAYQQALAEVGRAAGLNDDVALWDGGAFRVDVERRRSHALALGAASGGAGAQSRSPSQSLERGRLLRLKMMSVRAQTGSVPPALAAETLSLLTAAATAPTQAAVNPGGPPAGSTRSPVVDATADGANPERTARHAEARFLLCAARGAMGDRAGALAELSRVPAAERGHQSRALARAVCMAAIDENEDALASLAVGVYGFGPSSRFLTGQTRELQMANDWDALRRDPRFERIFR